MSRSHSRTSRRGRYDVGYERARQHIQEARELSQQLGGTDEDVKRYFFSLSSQTLQVIFNDYETRYGKDKRVYAEETFELWRSGRRQMSGLVASRLFELLPSRMPIEAKYQLVESLWSRLGPRSRNIVRIKIGSSEAEVAREITQHIERAVSEHAIPAALQKRFSWLSGDDVRAQQQLLNHLRELEKRQAIELGSIQAVDIIEHLRAYGDLAKGAAQIINIGSHQFELQYGFERQCVTPCSRNNANLWTSVFWLILIALIVYHFLKR